MVQGQGIQEEKSLDGSAVDAVASPASKAGKQKVTEEAAALAARHGVTESMTPNDLSRALRSAGVSSARIYSAVADLARGFSKVESFTRAMGHDKSARDKTISLFRS